ncbi:MAG: hypothetical protein D6798_19190 [Deltaproteobacteria bacterium]|nr:MAG: hypothetical protein D6798_19190 [Deltaproteobacteria bacterium]
MPDAIDAETPPTGEPPPPKGDRDGSGAFWDTKPELDWMGGYPIWACPEPDDDDYVLQAPAESALLEYFDNGHDGVGLRMTYTGSSQSEGCAELEYMIDLAQYGETIDHLMFAMQMWTDDFTPGGLEGMHSFPRHSWKGRSMIGWSDGNTYQPLMVPQPPAGTTGDNPYQDLCLVRVRPYRIEGAWRVHAPRELLAEYRWPEELQGGLFVAFDIRWGKERTSTGLMNCFFVEYNTIEPTQAWPEMPDDWELDDSLDDRATEE